jgi:hypothetical protein
MSPPTLTAQRITPLRYNLGTWRRASVVGGSSCMQPPVCAPDATLQWTSSLWHPRARAAPRAPLSVALRSRGCTASQRRTSMTCRRKRRRLGQRRPNSQPARPLETLRLPSFSVSVCLSVVCFRLCVLGCQPPCLPARPSVCRVEHLPGTVAHSVHVPLGST